MNGKEGNETEERGEMSNRWKRYRKMIRDERKQVKDEMKMGERYYVSVKLRRKSIRREER